MRRENMYATVCEICAYKKTLLEHKNEKGTVITNNGLHLPTLGGI